MVPVKTGLTTMVCLRELALVSLLIVGSLGQKKMFCYYNAEAQYRDGIGKFVPEDIDPTLCTHIVYAFANVSGLQLTPTNWNDQISGGLYERTVALKRINPDLKILLAVGGWEIGSEPFKDLAATWQSRNQFSKNVVQYLRQYGFDGLDMDWEFPATRGSPPEDKRKFTNLMQQLQNEFRKEAAETGNDKLLLTLAAASGTFYINQSYQPQQLIPTLDYMLLMSYNYHGNWENTTGHHTGLWPNNIDTDPKRRELNINWSVDYWLNQGMPKEKLIMGLSSYGMSYTLNFTNQNGVGAPARSGGRPGTYTDEAGILSYFEICENIKYKGWKTRYIPEQESPYAYSGDQWVGYDDKNSLTIKANYAKRRDLGGAMLWSVETDDFSGSCGEGQYPLLKTVNNIIRDGQTGRSSGGQQNNDYGNDNDYGGVNNVNDYRGNGGYSNYDNNGNDYGNYGNNNNDYGNYGNNGNDYGTYGNNNNDYGNYGAGRNSGQDYGGNDYGTGDEFNCNAAGPGSHADPNNCRQFYICTASDYGYRANVMTCPAGLVFDAGQRACNWGTGC